MKPFSKIGQHLTWSEDNDDLRTEEIFVNDKYKVRVCKKEDLIHLSITALDKRPAHNWREFQEIKNELVGPEHEGLELYPAESRLFDTANQYHIWVLADPEERLPVGWDEGRLTNNASDNGTVQRPRDE